MNTDSRKILFIAISATFFTIVIVCFSFQIGRNIVERYTPLVDAAMEVKLQTTTAHLWFEELIEGDETIEIESIWKNLEQSEWYAQAMLDGGTNEKGTLLLALNDSNLRKQIKNTVKGIQHFRRIAQERWASKSSSGVGSALDQQFDLAFSKLNFSASRVGESLQKLVTEELKTFKFTEQLVICLLLMLGAVITAVSLRFNTRRIKNLARLKLSEENILTSQHQLQDVINGAKLGYWDWNYKTGEHLVNDEWLSILGLTRQDITNNIRDWNERIHPDDEADIKSLAQVHIQSGKNYVTEFRMKHADGSWVWIQGSGSVVEYNKATQEPVRLCGTHQNITARKSAELRDKSRTKVLELLNSGETLPNILDAILRGIEEENSAMLCSVLLLDDTGKQLRNGVSPSLPNFYNEAIEGVDVGEGVGSCGTAAYTNERVIVEDIQKHPYWKKFKGIASKAGLGSCWSEPIRSSTGEVLGTFAIYHQEVNRPTKANIELIEQVARLASIAIEKVQANIALKESDEQMQLVLAGAELGFWDWNIATDKMERNERWANMLGYTHEEISHTTNQWIDFVHQDDRDKAWQSINDVLEGRSKLHNLEYRMLTKEGGYKWIHDQANVMQRDITGKPLRMSGTHTDITERKQAEEKLKLAASVFTQARESIIITDTTSKIIDVNDTFVTTTGYSRESVIGKNPRFLKSGRQSTEFYLEMWQALLKDDYWSGEVWNRRKNGEIYAEIKTISAVRDEQGVTQNYVALGNDITPIKKHQEQLEHIAHYDILTNLPNRSLLADRLSQAMLQCDRHDRMLAVVFLDLDGFKQVNDAYGHDVGDELLVTLSGRMTDALRENDSLARIGGDEFVAVLTDLTIIEDCEPIIERLLVAASKPVTLNYITVNVSASIGVTFYPKDHVDADLLMRHADQAMYVAKESGKNRYHLFDTAQDDAVKIERESLEAIRDALDNNQFVLHYQPKVNMRTGAIEGIEALIRWQHPDRGLLNPIDFLPVAENNSMIIEIGEWVIDTALAQISHWQKADLNFPIRISVNIAAIQLQQPDFKSRLTALLATYPDVRDHSLELEVLETSALDDVNHVSMVMKSCMDLGVNFALDDFGTGYSSLTYLRRLPADLIKIDQSFVRDMLDDADDLAIVESVIGLAKSFKRGVIAEGVETIEHGTALLNLGCELAQGYGIAKPMPASDFPVWAKNWKPNVNWKI